MWNECSQVFTKERLLELQKLANAPEAKQKHTTLTKIELEACKNVFVLKDCHVIIANQVVKPAGGGGSFRAKTALFDTAAERNLSVSQKFSNSHAHEVKTSLNDSLGPEDIVAQPESTQNMKMVQMSNLKANKVLSSSTSAKTPLVKPEDSKLTHQSVKCQLKRKSEQTIIESRTSSLLVKDRKDAVTVGQILSYHHNEVNVICKFVNLHDLFQTQVN